MKDLIDSPQVIDYATNISRGESLILHALREETEKLPEAVMMITPLQGRFLELLVRWGKAKHVLEIGTFTGYSALSMALALPSDGQVFTLDKNKEWTEIAQRYWERAGVAHKIQLYLGLAHKILETLEGPFDMIFIDADKQRYLTYYEMCLKLLRPGGILVFDNTLWEGTVADVDNQEDTPTALRTFNATLRDDERVFPLLLPIVDGMTLGIKL